MKRSTLIITSVALFTNIIISATPLQEITTTDSTAIAYEENDTPAAEITEENEIQLLFSSQFNTEDEFNRWTVIDANADNSTWKFDLGISTTFYGYNSINAADDWLISPAITSPQSGTAIVSFKVKGSSYTEKLEVMYGNAPNVEAMTSRICDIMTLNENETSHSFMINVSPDIPFHIGFRACSDADKWRIYLYDMTVKSSSDNLGDLSISEITSPTSKFEMGQESVSIKIKNIGNTDIDSINVAFSIDDLLIATETINTPLLQKSETEYTFTTKVNLDIPGKKYTIKAWTIYPNDINNYNDTCHIDVIHKTPSPTPYFMGFESYEYTDDITYLNSNNDDWYIYADPYKFFPRTGDFCLMHYSDRLNNSDDWTILNPIKIEEAGYYKLTFWYSTKAEFYEEKLRVCYGSNNTPDAMTNTIVEFDPLISPLYKESVNIIYLEKQEKLYIGFNALSEKDNYYILIDDISVEKISEETIDLAVVDLQNPGEYIHKNSNKSVSFTTKNLGLTDVDATVHVTIDNNIAYEESITLNMLEERKICLDDLLSMLNADSHQLSIEITASGDTDIDNNNITHTFQVMGEATKFWDFEDGKIPDNFTYFVEDNGTVSPSNGSYINQYGWGICDSQQHPLHGNYMLAGTSKLDVTEQADRWIVLPECIPAENTFLSWDAASSNLDYRETYSLMIYHCDENNPWDENIPYDYNRIEHYIKIDTLSKTHGISLSEYAGDTIYIAFRLNSKNCETLLLDNIGIYGANYVSNIENIKKETHNIIVDNGRIRVEGIIPTSITLVDINGRIVAQTIGQELSISNITEGIYIVTIATDNGTYREKIIIKKQ